MFRVIIFVCSRFLRLASFTAYPHQWMTEEELTKEMLRTSTHFHDLRPTPGEVMKGEIGSLSVEILSCTGLPKLDIVLDHFNAAVYLVCGSYAFMSDTISNKRSPMWLRRSKRACVFPIFHAYAQLFVGVFDQEEGSLSDHFAGRVVLDLFKLRPGTVYDASFPLRISNDGKLIYFIAFLVT